jgi:hypothetical protein
MFKLLEPVVLKTDVPERGLRKGLLGTVVEVYSPAKVEVEFIAANGRTIALLPLDSRDLRKPTDTDAIAVARTSKRKGVVIGPFRTDKPRRASGSGPKVKKARVTRSGRSARGTTRRRRTA